jgi:hypothetical protein
VTAKYIFGVLSASFAVLSIVRVARHGTGAHPESRTWLLIAAIFGTVSAWLFYRT